MEGVGPVLRERIPCPQPVGGLEREHLGSPALGRDPCAFGGDDIGRLVGQVAHDLPADRGIAVEQPAQDGHAGSPVPAGSTLWFSRNSVVRIPGPLERREPGRLGDAVDGTGRIRPVVRVLVRVAALDGVGLHDRHRLADPGSPGPVVVRVDPVGVRAQVEPRGAAGERHRILADPGDRSALERDREVPTGGSIGDVVHDGVQRLWSEHVGVQAADVRAPTPTEDEVVRGLDLQVRLAGGADRRRLGAAAQAGRVALDRVGGAAVVVRDDDDRDRRRTPRAARSRRSARPRLVPWRRSRRRPPRPRERPTPGRSGRPDAGRGRTAGARTRRPWRSRSSSRRRASPRTDPAPRPRWCARTGHRRSRARRPAGCRSSGRSSVGADRHRHRASAPQRPCGR